MADFLDFTEGQNQLLSAGLPATCYFLLSTKACSGVGGLVVGDTLAGGVGEITGTGYTRQSQARPTPASGSAAFAQMAWSTGSATNSGQCADASSASIAPSGQVLASGSLAESFTSACAPSGIVTATGRCSDAVAFTIAAAGAGLLSGSLAERKTGMDSPTGTASASGTLATATSPGQVTLTVRAVFNVTLTEV